MYNLEQAVSFVKSQLSKDFIFINVKPDILHILIDGVEELQREHAAMKEVLESAKYYLNRDSWLSANKVVTDMLTTLTKEESA